MNTIDTDTDIKVINQQIDNLESEINKLSHRLKELRDLKLSQQYYTNGKKTLLVKFLCKNQEMFVCYMFEKYSAIHFHIDDEIIQKLHNKVVLSIVSLMETNLNTLVPITQEEYLNLRNTEFKIED